MEYDVPSKEKVNAGDIRTMADGSRWIVESAVLHNSLKRPMYRLRVIPDTPANRKRIAQMERDI